MEKNTDRSCRCNIYQLKDDEDERLFLSYDRVVKKGILPGREDYRLVYTEDVEGTDDIMVMNALYNRLNIELPPHFYGHTPSVSDVMEVVRADSDKWYYIDRIGFKELKDFAQDKKESSRKEKTYFVPVVYEMYGRVPVKAVSPKEAYEWANEHIDELKLPSDASYLEDSFEVDGSGIIMDEEENMYTSSDDC